MSASLPTIFVDLDDVTFDLKKDWCRAYNAVYREERKHVPEDEFYRSWNVESFYPGAMKLLDTQFLFRDLQPIPGAKEGIHTLQERGHDVLFLSSALSKYAASEKLDCVEEHFGKEMRSKVILAHEKHHVGSRYDILIDDRPLNLQKFRGYSIKFAAPHNVSDPWALEAKDWTEVVKLVDKVVESIEWSLP